MWRKSPHELFEEFKKDWCAALRPSVTEYILRCQPEGRDELGELIEDYMAHAPDPPYSEVQLIRLEEKLRTDCPKLMEAIDAIAEGK